MKAKIRESRIDKTKLLNQAICAATKPPKVFVSFSGVGKFVSLLYFVQFDFIMSSNNDAWCELVGTL